LVSKSPPNCGDVSSTTSPPNSTAVMFGFVPSSALAKANIVLPFAIVAEVPDPDAYLKTTF
tara:strand:- start:1561 stop:1743 length:183 start_codon:yes stop_codon:yes gene_type:complete